jgi:nephrocystin-3
VSEQQASADGADRREIRVFVSSTFRGMHAEREELLKRVFPELRRRCRERAVELTEIDLRWGVTEEEARQGKVVEICLDEVRRCRCFIGILGELYGWRPGLEDLHEPDRFFGKYPWVRELMPPTRGAPESERRTGVTELEILLGALREPQKARGAFFYFRARPEGDAARPEGPAVARLQEDLERRIRDSGLPLKEGYGDVATLGRWVREDLTRLLDERYPADQTPSPLEQRRLAHAAFADSRLRSYVEDADLLARLDAHAAAEGPPLAVLGESGAGKSALLACWARRWRGAHPEAFVIEHYVGAESQGGDHLGLLLRVMNEIKERCGVAEEVPGEPQQIEQALPRWLAYARRTGLVLALDAVNQIEGDGLLRWLPEYVPPWVRLIVSTTPGPTQEALARRGWPTLTVGPLDDGRRERVIDGYLGGFRKALGPEQRRLLADDAKCSNPLFLRTVLEELRIFGSFERLTERVRHYLEPPALDGLFERVLGRLEQDHGAELVRESMALLWAARRGLSETALLELTGRTRLALSELLAAMDYHLLTRRGLLGFFHDDLRRAVQARYVGTPERERALRLRIADYFAAQPVGERRVDELPWQLRRAEEWGRLKECIADVPTFMGVREEAHKYELMGYWLALGSGPGVAEAYERSLAKYEEGGPEPVRLAAVLTALGRFLNVAAGPTFAELLHRRALAIREEALGDDPATASSLSNVATLLHVRGDRDAPEPLHRRALAIREKALGPDHPDVAISLNNLAVLLSGRGEHDAAESLLRRALAIKEKALGPEDPRTAEGLNNLAQSLQDRGELEEAEAMLRRCLAINEKALGEDHPALADSLNNLALLLVAKRDYEAAEPLLRRAVAVAERTLGPEHSKTAFVLNSLAGLLLSQGDADGAEPLHRRALAIAEKALGPDDPMTALYRKNLRTLRAGRAAAYGCFALLGAVVLALLVGACAGFRWLLSQR